MPLNPESVISAGHVMALIEEARAWKEFHRKRGEIGRFEVIASNIRLKALVDALKGAK